MTVSGALRAIKRRVSPRTPAKVHVRCRTQNPPPRNWCASSSLAPGTCSARTYSADLNRFPNAVTRRAGNYAGKYALENRPDLLNELARLACEAGLRDVAVWR
jgi:hypothetical protein